MVAFEDAVRPMAAGVDDPTRTSSPPERRPRARVSWRGRDAPSSPEETSATVADVNSSFPAPRPRVIFPKQLLEVLSDPASGGVIEWLVHGHAFAIKKPDRFAKDIMPRFTRGKLTSFQRQLNLYGFRKVSKGMDYKAGALVYFHPAFKRGRPEMMEGIKRIACKGECTLNRLRNEEVPYDPSVFSEDTDAPEQDVNSLDIGVRKRNRGWPFDYPAMKRTQAAPRAQKEVSEAAPRRVNEPVCGALPLMDDAPVLSEVKPDVVAAGLDAILDPDLAILPAAPPAIDFGRLPLMHGKRFALGAGAINEVPQRSYGKQAAAFATRSIPHSSPGTSTSATASARSVMTPLFSRPYTASTLPRSLNLYSPREEYASPPERSEADEGPLANDEPLCIAKQFTMPPPKSQFTQARVEDLLPLPFQRSSSDAVEKGAPDLQFAKRFGDAVGPMGNEPLMRNVSEVSGLSNASDLWRGCEELERDIDFAGLFE